MIKYPFNSKKISSREYELISVSRDASFYSIKPQLIVRPEDEFDVIALFNAAKRNKSSITFRAAGTSLSGQTLSDSVIADISRRWEKVEIIDGGRKIKTQPGVIGGHLNRKLSPYGRTIGPDPASLNACMAGGILANNSSGMRSGIFRNAYNSVDTLRFILADGTIVDTSRPDADLKLRADAPEIYAGLLDLRDEILADTNLVNKIKSQYSVKNVVGYSLNSFIDFEKPSDILAHLMIGSEGTLGFISEAILLTYPFHKHKLTGMLVFPSVENAAEAILPVRQCDVSALEIVDNKSLHSVEDMPAIKNLLGEIDNSIAILLFEFQEPNREIVESKLSGLYKTVKSLNLMRQPVITWDSSEQGELWSIRSGLLPSLGATRTSGTTFILEDICVPLDKIHKAIPSLIDLFEKFGYNETGIYGHGMDGNLHFMLTQNFSSSKEIERYRNFMDALAEIVIDRYGGSMKAEHGTGRNITPFVEKQWGSKAYGIMKRIKKLLDPWNILNPGVLLNEDEKCHIKNIKDFPVLNNEADKCIECGFCEPVCPSADFTVSPRKRIVLLREYVNSGKQNAAKRDDYVFAVNDTCVVDGLCSTACPVGINTGDIVKNNRGLDAGLAERKTADFLSEHFFVLELISKVNVYFGHLAEYLFGQEFINNMLERIKRIFGLNKIYHWNSFTGYPAKLVRTEENSYEFLYFPTCVSRITGKPRGSKEPSLIETVKELSDKAKINLKIPANINDYCCGNVFASKGFYDAYVNSVNRLMQIIWEESGEGRLPVIFDASSCLNTVRNCRADLFDEMKSKYDKMTILDMTEFLSDYILPNINITNKLKRVVLHQNCSLIKLGIENKMLEIACKCAEEVIVPESQGCCGMGGDRGLLFPGLTQSATKYEAAEIRQITADGYFSSNLPCETAMSSAVNRQYLSIAYLVNDVAD